MELDFSDPNSDAKLTRYSGLLTMLPFTKAWQNETKSSDIGTIRARLDLVEVIPHFEFHAFEAETVRFSNSMSLSFRPSLLFNFIYKFFKNFCCALSIAPVFNFI
jgi:hypothetical protein